jgi:hypothetical protein
MLSMERVIEIARSVVEIRTRITANGHGAMIDNNLHDGIELARAVNGGYVSQLTTAGERRLTVTAHVLAGLQATLAGRAVLRDPDGGAAQMSKVNAEGAGPIEGTTPDGLRFALVRTDSVFYGAVFAGETVTADHTEGDEPYARFVVTGAVWRDDLDEGQLCMVGRWESYKSSETYPMSTNGFQARWEPIHR